MPQAERLPRGGSPNPGPQKLCPSRDDFHCAKRGSDGLNESLKDPWIKKKKTTIKICLGGHKAGQFKRMETSEPALHTPVQSMGRSLREHIKIHRSTKRNFSKPLFLPLASLRKPPFATHISLTLLPTAFLPPPLVDPLPPHQEGVLLPKRLYRAPTVPALILSKTPSQLISST